MKDVEQAVDKSMVAKASGEDRIRELAYRKYISRGDDGGDPAADWLEAEAEVDADADVHDAQN